MLIWAQNYIAILIISDINFGLFAYGEVQS